MQPNQRRTGKNTSRPAKPNTTWLRALEDEGLIDLPHGSQVFVRPRAIEGNLIEPRPVGGPGLPVVVREEQVSDHEGAGDQDGAQEQGLEGQVAHRRLSCGRRQRLRA